MSLRFLTHDLGYKDQIANVEDFLGAPVTAVLVDTAQVPDRATENAYSAISANECSDVDYAQVALTGKTIAVEGDRVRFNCAKIDFGASVSISARYLYLVFGTAGSLVAGDRILGHIDLTGTGNASSVSAEFSVTPPATGLFEVLRSNAP